MGTNAGTLQTLKSTEAERSPKHNALNKRPGSKPRRITGIAKVNRFIREQQPATPFLVVDLDIVGDNYRALRRTLPMTDVYYAVKANPAPEVIGRLVELGSSFDVASMAEIKLVMGSGADASQISFGNTIKKEGDIAWAYKRGVRLFAFDSEAELLKLARSAPGAKVFSWSLSAALICDDGAAKTHRPAM